MKHPVYAEPVDSRSFDSCAALLAIVSFKRIEDNCLRLLVGLDLAHSAIVSKGAITLFHLLHDAELLTLR